VAAPTIASADVPSPGRASFLENRHPMYDRDAGHRWLRQLFAEAAASG
jgi:hypothetical protein